MNRNIKRITFFSFLFIILFIINACNKKEQLEKQQNTYTIGVVTKSKDSEYWMSVCSGMEKAANDFDVSVLIISPDTETDDEVQEKMIFDFIDKGVDALAISPIRSYDADSYIKESKKHDIPIFSYDTKIVDDSIPYIGIDNKKIGMELAEYMSERLNNKGKIGIISGDLEQAVHKERVIGFQTYIEENTEIEIVFIESGYSNLQISEKEISRLMKEHPDTNGIFATSAVTALGIMEYMRDRPVIIATVDAQQDAILAVKNEGIAVLATQSGYDIGYETIRYIIKEKETGNLEKEKIIEAEIITKETVEEYEKNMR